MTKPIAHTKRPEKKAALEEIRAAVRDAGYCFLLNYGGLTVSAFSARRKMAEMPVFALSGCRKLAGMPVFALSGCREMAGMVVSALWGRRKLAGMAAFGVFQRAAGVATAVVSPRGFPRGPGWQAEDARRRYGQT